MSESIPTRALASDVPATLDALVVGAGFAGVYQLHGLRRIGMTARVLEAGEGVGGTWYWNRYPGARCDVESLDYSYSFSEALQQEWNWSERYATQPELLRYINAVVDRFDLRRDIEFNARVREAIFDEASALWRVATSSGERFSARFLIMATGCLSIPQAIEFPGLDSFRGAWHHSANWPTEGVDFEGKKVGLIGTGSSGVQMAPIIAESAAQLTVFQRTANFSVPSQNEPLSAEHLAEVKSHYAQRRALARETATGHFLVANDKSAMQVTPEEREKEFEFRWRGAGGGFRMLRAFNDLLVNKDSNDAAAEFVRSKIRAIVKDPATADLLCPTRELPFGTKRLCVDTDYYETFNRPNVTLVDVKADPIVEIVPRGLRTRDREYPLDVIVFATGFDAMTGAMSSIDIRGRGGERLRDKWQHGPRTYLGLAVAGFPNLFILAGPGSPSVLSNMVHSIELHVDWLTDCLQGLRAAGKSTMEAKQRAEDDWVSHVNEIAHRTLYPTANSWYMGANIPGKPRVLVLSVDYRLAPEHLFPAALDDARAALAWAASEGAERTGQGARPWLAVMGDSAGGNLATVASRLHNRASGLGYIDFQVLAYPVTDHRFDTGSYQEFAEGNLLTRKDMIWFWDQYCPDVSRRSDPDVSPLRIEDLSGSPPAFVLTAGRDPLRDEGEAYGRRLAAAGVPCELQRYDGLVHGFLAMVNYAPQAQTAFQDLTRSMLRSRAEHAKANRSNRPRSLP